MPSIEPHRLSAALPAGYTPPTSIEPHRLSAALPAGYTPPPSIEPHRLSAALPAGYTPPTSIEPHRLSAALPAGYTPPTSIAVPIRPRKITAASARRLDRLSVRAHRFHRFAHHPLCERYAGEVVRIGRVRLCRGCTFAIAGGAIGGCAGLAIGGSVVTGIAACAVAIVTLLATLYRSARPHRAIGSARVPKLVTRLAPAALFLLAITCGVLATSLAGAAVAAFAAAAVVGLRVLYGRRGADRSPCASCPERELSPCSGFAPIVLRERAFQRIAARYVR